VPADQARARAAVLLARLNIPQRLWSLSPTTFSGGEQQRVNIARGFAHDYPALLLDEPTASLDVVNREVVLTLIEEAKARGCAILGIFHDEAARDRVCDRTVDMRAFTPKLISSSGGRGTCRASCFLWLDLLALVRIPCWQGPLLPTLRFTGRAV
jgi:alpha-D-ribose 1-methylphosphonate 5-triphosphate synthase subunit PhnL